MTADAIGGVWPYTLDLGRGLRRHGVDVHVAVMGPSPSDRQRRDAAAAGLVLHDVPARLEWMDDPWAEVDQAGDTLLALEREIDPALVHLNGYVHAALPWRVPVLVVAHSCVCSWWRAVQGDPAPPRFDEYRARVSRGVRAAAAIIAPSIAMLGALEDEYGPVASTLVIPNGSSFEPVRDRPREPIIFAAGRLWDEGKNVAALCAAAPHLPWPVFVAGATRDPQGRSAVAPGVRHLGSLSADDMRGCYARASIYALPARYEPFGLSVLEAARSGCALVLGDIRSLRENWDGAAVFVPPDNRRALAGALQELIGDEPRRLRLAAAAEARAARFTVGRMVSAYLETYSRMGVAVA